jgi:hypothetical protein
MDRVIGIHASPRAAIDAIRDQPRDGLEGAGPR